MAENIVGIDIGGTKTRISLLTNGKTEDLYLGPTEQDPGLELEMLLRELSRNNITDYCKGIGIACPAPLDCKNGIIQSPPNLKQWKNFCLKDELEKTINIPVKLENDGNAGALGETVYGAGKGYSNVFYFTISTGIGSGIIIDKKIYSGANGLAGELWGFFPTFYARTLSKLIGNDNIQTIMDLSSGNGIVKQASIQINKGAKTIISKNDISTYTIIDALKKGDKLATEIINDAISVLAATISFAVSILDPELVVLGGGLCFDESLFVNPIIEKLRNLETLEQFKNVKISRAKLWDKAAIYGAVSLFE
jgi:glucokinase